MRIGIFDSGIGGVTVLRELHRVSKPEMNFFYFGDSANVPYGNKSPEVIRLLCQNAAQFLRDRQLDALIIACNTASAHALSVFQEALPGVPVMGVVQPGVYSVLAALQKRPDLNPVPVFVFSTKATAQSRIYSREILRQRASKFQCVVSEIACPVLVALVEQGWWDHPILHLAIRDYVAPFYSQEEMPYGIALLGCTHFPWIQPAFEEALPGWEVINSAEAVVRGLFDWEQFRSFALSDSSGEPLQNLDQLKKSSRIEWYFSDAQSALTIPTYSI